MANQAATWSESRAGYGWLAPREGVALTLLAFAAALTVFLLIPPFLTQQFGWVPGFTGQEAADLLTPIISMPLFVLAVELTGRSSTRIRLILVALAAVWIAGQGIHLATNAIGDVFREGAERDAFYATTAGNLDLFLDEVLSHWLWHAAWVGLLVVLLWVGVTGPVGSIGRGAMAAVLAGVAGAVHGFTWFVVTDEGGTWLLAIPATAVLLGLALLVQRRDGSGRVVTTFLVVGAVLTLALYGVWIVLFGWPPSPILDQFKVL